jgi:hypothetical protein
VAAGTEPRKTAFEALKASKQAALDYSPTPRDTVECGSFSRPDLGCKDEQADSEAAYAQALLWCIMDNKTYAANAIRIMNAWSAILTGGHTNNTGPVQASWTGDVWPRAAGIMRYSNAGWSTESPDSRIRSARSICPPSFTAPLGVKMWRGRAPVYIYVKSDGPKPTEAPGCGPAIWGNKGIEPEFVEGLLQESYRDSEQAGLAFAGMVDAAETARQQGLDLYAEQGKRIMAAMEFQARFLPPHNAAPPPHLEFNRHPTWEIAYNHFHDRLGIDLARMRL